MKLTQYILTSPAGSIYLIANETALTGAFWKPQPVPMITQLKDSAILSEAVKQLEEYFAGKRREFKLPLEPRGTEFQKSVWNELTQIPYGATVSYKDIAIRIKNEKGVRAVGLANGRNPLCIFIPCHRVIGSNGKLTGYAGGLENKTRLLEIERSFKRRR